MPITTRSVSDQSLQRHLWAPYLPHHVAADEWLGAASADPNRDVILKIRNTRTATAKKEINKKLVSCMLGFLFIWSDLGVVRGSLNE